MTATWKEAEPPVLPPPTPAQKIRGAVRLVAVFWVTLTLLALFMLGRGLKAVFGPRIVFHYAMARLWSRLMLAIFGLKPVVRGAPVRRGGVLTANHASWLDIIALRHAARTNFVSKAEVRAWPGVGAIAAICETVFIERKRTAAKRQQEELHRRIVADELLCIFPEGTSTDGLRVLPFKSTLMSVLFIEGVHEQALVQPVSVIYRVPPKLDLPVNFYGWWGSMPFGAHVWAVACRSSGGVVEVIFHEAARAADWTDRKALTQHCEIAVRGGFESSVPQKF
ncbi:MAG: lysophospholipid acyltransferase family protein [Pikeienuella sp.]